jgi:hypothetical protein
MLNSKETLKKLHRKFPQMSLDELFDALDCYVEEYNFLNKPYYGTYTDADFRIKDTITSTNPLFKVHDGNISTTAEPRSIQLAASH